MTAPRDLDQGDLREIDQTFLLERDEADHLRELDDAAPLELAELAELACAAVLMGCPPMDPYSARSDFALQLAQADVPVALLVTPGACHASEARSGGTDLPAGPCRPGPRAGAVPARSGTTMQAASAGRRP